MSGPRRVFLFLVLLCSFPFPEEHRAEATANETLIQDTADRRIGSGLDPGLLPENVLKKRDRLVIESRIENYLIALAEGQEGTAQSAVEKTAGEEQTPTAAPGAVVEKPPVTGQKKPAKTTATPRPRPATMPMSRSQTPGSSLAPQKAATSAPAAPPRSSLPAAQTDEHPASSPKPSSLIQMLEGREDELMLWLGIAITFFIIGWVCGGNFYLRRDRKSRRKLRF